MKGKSSKGAGTPYRIMKVKRANRVVRNKKRRK